MGIFDFFKKKKVKQEKSLPKKSAEVEEVKELMKEISKAGGFDKYQKKWIMEFHKENNERFEESIKHLSPENKKYVEGILKHNGSTKPEDDDFGKAN